MIIRILTTANPGQTTLADSGTGSWPAVWRGESPAPSGHDYDVEVDFDAVQTWLPALNEARPGIHLSDNDIVICAEVSAVDADGVAVLDLSPGIVLVELEGSRPDLVVGQRVRLVPTIVSLFPTGL
jgi:hypothetical protein